MCFNPSKEFSTLATTSPFAGTGLAAAGHDGLTAVVVDPCSRRRRTSALVEEGLLLSASRATHGVLSACSR